MKLNDRVLYNGQIHTLITLPVRPGAKGHAQIINSHNRAIIVPINQLKPAPPKKKEADAITPTS